MNPTQEELQEATQDLSKFIQKLNAMMNIIGEGKGNPYFKLRLMEDIVKFKLKLFGSENKDIKGMEKQFQAYLNWGKIKINVSEKKND